MEKFFFRRHIIEQNRTDRLRMYTKEIKKKLNKLKYTKFFERYQERKKPYFRKSVDESAILMFIPLNIRT